MGNGRYFGLYYFVFGEFRGKIAVVEWGGWLESKDLKEGINGQKNKIYFWLLPDYGSGTGNIGLGQERTNTPEFIHDVLAKDFGTVDADFLGSHLGSG
jgi:hypothetical protein